MKTGIIQKTDSCLRAVPPVWYFVVFTVFLLLFAPKIVEFVIALIAAVLILNGLFHIILAVRNFCGRLFKFLV